jgi:hypothetical protein
MIHVFAYQAALNPTEYILPVEEHIRFDYRRSSDIRIEQVFHCFAPIHSSNINRELA